MLRVYGKKFIKKKVQNPYGKNKKFLLRLHVPLHQVKLVRFYTTNNDNPPLTRGPLRDQFTDERDVGWQLIRREHSEPSSEWQPRGRNDWFRKLLRKFGIHEVSPEVARLFGYDVTDENQPDTPILTPPSPDAFERFVTSIGGLYPGFTFAGAVRPALRGQHFYLSLVNIGRVSDIAKATGLSPEAVRDALQDPHIFLALWMGCVMTGGASFEPDGLNELLSGGSTRALVTKAGDPIRAQRLTKRELDEQWTVFNTFLALALYGHALMGSASHSMGLIRGEYIVYCVAGAGRQRLSLGAYANIWVACARNSGMWWVTSKHMERVLKDPGTASAICELHRSGNTQEVLKIIARSKHADGVWAYVRAYAGHVVRVPSWLYGHLKGTPNEPKSLK